MKVYDAGTIRNVAIVGHSGCGKTQLIAAMLFAAGAVKLCHPHCSKFCVLGGGSCSAR